MRGICSGGSWGCWRLAVAVDPRAFREAIRTVDVSYPIPYLVSVVLAFGLALLAFACALGGALRICLVLAALACAAYALALIAFTVLRKPELLRSERHTQISRLIEVVSDRDTAPDARGAARDAIRFLSETKGLKRDIAGGDESDG